MPVSLCLPLCRVPTTYDAEKGVLSWKHTPTKVRVGATGALCCFKCACAAAHTLSSCWQLRSYAHAHACTFCSTLALSLHAPLSKWLPDGSALVQGAVYYAYFAPYPYERHQRYHSARACMQLLAILRSCAACGPPVGCLRGTPCLQPLQEFQVPLPL